ncbi:hypothetical protein D1007_33837 [Hordeum vulgare]|nr:hypothetical protein D1007_33837 [Hordeum vulgare]
MEPTPAAEHQESQPMARHQESQPTSSDLGERRGLFSCLFSECDDPPFNDSNLEAHLLETILHLYEEAFERLPVHDMPVEAADQLAISMRKGGLCLGLLDPVANIILNTIALLPHDFGYMAAKRRRSKRLAGRRDSSSSWVVPSSCRRVTWRSIAVSSCRALVRFMVGYFGCLSEEQATRYLHWAHADLALAVQLVEHDLRAAHVAPPDPASARTQAAFKYAAICGWHPAPDDLLRLHASPLPKQRLRDAAPFLNKGGRKLTVHHVITIMDLLRYQEGAAVDLQVNLLPSARELVVYCRNLKADEGNLDISNTTSSDDFHMVTIKVERHGYHFAALRSPEDYRSMMSSCLKGAAEMHRVVNSCSSDACEYTLSLRMRLYDMIHGFYLKVFAMLPSTWLDLIPHILYAGHCYGPLDPVSNIITNSILHRLVRPIPWLGSKIKVYDILDTLSMLRVEVRSLEGLIALVRASSKPRCSTQQAMEHLSCKRCDLSQESHTSQQFAAAAAAARHPYDVLGSSLAPSLIIDLRRMLATSANGRISSESLEQIMCILKETCAPMCGPLLPYAAKLSKEAKETLLEKRSHYMKMKLFIHAELAQVLKKYAFEHPLEPKYVPSVICGLVAASESLDRFSYHVNFVAASESGIADNQLFFADINAPFSHPSKPSFCCRLPLTSAGRCYYRKASARKIVYPDSSELLECDCDITDYGTRQTDGMLEPDFILEYRRDAGFAEDLRKYCEEQKKRDEY